MIKEKTLNEVEELLCEGKNKVLPTKWDYYLTEDMKLGTFVDEQVYCSWRIKAMSFLKSFLPETNDFVKVFEIKIEHNYENAEICIQTLQNIKEYIEKGYIFIEEKETVNINDTLGILFSRFHKVARQLRNRHKGRPTLEIEDEYDVQDLLHALLQLYFNDIRNEEWTPSYAGKCARVDFLLKNEKIVIEVKKTRQGLTDKELGDQLIIDIDRYKSHPDCEKLICFVYDPEGRIGNPNGIINDLNKQHEEFVDVIIQPNI